MKQALWVGVLLVLVAGSVAGAAELALEYPQTGILGEPLQFTLTSDVPLAGAAVLVVGGAFPEAHVMSAVDPFTYQVTFVPVALVPGTLRVYVAASSEMEGLVTYPPGAPGEGLVEIALVEDTVPPDFVFLNPNDEFVAGQRAGLAFMVPTISGTVDPETVQAFVDGEPAEAVSAEPDFVFVWHTFQQAGTHTVEIRGADLWGNIGDRAFSVEVARRGLIETRFTLRTDASAAVGQSPVSLRTRLDGFAGVGSLTVNGHFTQGLSGPTPSQRYSLQAEWNPRLPLRLKGSLGAFTARGHDLVLNTGIDEGLGVEGDLWVLSGGYSTGIMNRASGTTAQIAAGTASYERNVAGLHSRLAFGNVLTLGMSGVFVSDRFGGFCTLDADGCVLPQKARANAAAGIQAGFGLFGASLTTEAAASLDMPRIQRAVPFSGGSIVLGPGEVEDRSRVTPSDFFTESRYAKWTIPQFTLTELMDTTNPAVLPGVALRSRLTLPRILGVGIEAEYTFADSGFDSLAATGPKGEESLSGEITAQIPIGGRTLQLTLRGEDSREVKANMMLDAVLAAVAAALDTTPADSGGSVASVLERTQELSASARIVLGRFTLRPSFSHEVKGEQSFGPFESIWAKSPGLPISAVDRTSHETSYGVRIEGFEIAQTRLKAGVVLKSAVEYVGGVPQGAVPGSTLEIEAQRGAYAARATLDNNPLADQQSSRFRVSWSGDILSAGLGWEQLVTSGEPTENRLELDVSAFVPLGASATLGAGVNYALVRTAGGETTPSGSLYAYHQWNF